MQDQTAEMLLGGIHEALAKDTKPIVHLAAKNNPSSNLGFGYRRAADGIVYAMHALGVEAIPGPVSYETLPQTELDELRRAKRLRDEAIKSLRGDANTHEKMAATRAKRVAVATHEGGLGRVDPNDVDAYATHQAKAEACRAALRYLGADDER